MIQFLNVPSLWFALIFLISLLVNLVIRIADSCLVSAVLYSCKHSEVLIGLA